MMNLRTGGWVRLWVAALILLLAATARPQQDEDPADEMRRSQRTVDPMWIVMREGGPFHARFTSPQFESYKQRLRETLDQALAHALRFGQTGAFMVVGIDQMGMVNTAYGHEAGDADQRQEGERQGDADRRTEQQAANDADRDFDGFGPGLMPVGRCGGENGDPDRAGDQIGKGGGFLP